MSNISNINSIQTPGRMITCPSCQQPFEPDIQQIYDVRQDPTAKNRLLSGQANMMRCPNCGFQMAVAVPLAYHDPDKELLLVHVPMELNLSNDEQERLVGQLTRTITDSLPQEERKGYLLNPKRALTLQGMIETILEADGITKEMLEERRQKAQLMQRLIEAGPEQAGELAQEHDAELDEEFFQMITFTIENALANGQQQQAQYIAAVRDALLEVASYGQEVQEAVARQEAAVQEVSQDLQKMGQAVTRDKLLDLALQYAEEDEKLQVLVGMIRQALDYDFFQLFSERIDQAKSKPRRNTLRQVRDRLLELTQQVDQQRQAQLQQASLIVQEIINSDDVEAAVEEAMPVLSDLVIAVIEANLRMADENGDAELKSRLQEVYDIIRRKISESAPPEVQFINRLLSAENDTEARLLLVDEAPQYGDTLLQYMDALIEDLSARGGAGGVVERLQSLRDEARKVMSG